HPLPGGLLDARLVDGPPTPRLHTVAQDRHLESHSLLDGVRPLHRLLDDGAEVLLVGLGQETDMTEVDAEQCRSCATRELGTAQQCAVAPKDNDQLAPPRCSLLG